MKVEKEACERVSEGTILSLEELSLPIKGTGGLLIVFWKEK